MEINKDIQNKAKGIIVAKLYVKEQEQAVKDYIKLCIEANICPKCGEELEQYSKPKGVYVDFIYKCSCNWEYITQFHFPWC